MLVSGVEPLFADTCDGDAPAAVVATVASHADLPAPALTASRGPLDSGGPAGVPVDHAVHLCHCTHTHGGLDQVAYAIESHEAVVLESGMPSPVVPPSGPALEAPLRPPAVTQM